MANKTTKILLFSGGSDSVLNYYLTNPDYLVYVNIHGFVCNGVYIDECYCCVCVCACVCVRAC